MEKKIKILIADDHEMVRRGIKYVINHHFIGTSIAEVTNGNDIFKAVVKQTFDLLIMDFKMPDTDTLSLISTVRLKATDMKILVFSMYPEELMAKRVLNLGAMGYLEKDAPETEFVKAVQLILNGERYVSPKITKQLIEQAVSGEAFTVFDALSDREFEVMMLLLNGKNLQEISKTINLHNSTVATYKTRLFQKLEVNNMVELMQLATNYGLV